VVDTATITLDGAAVGHIARPMRIVVDGLRDTIDLPGGTGIRLHAAAFDSGGVLLYTGVDTVDLLPGAVVVLHMGLLRASGDLAIHGVVRDSLPPGTLLHDDFEDGVLDPLLWLASADHGTGDIPRQRGDSLSERGGVLRLVQATTDFGGRVFSAPLRLDTAMPLVITCSTRVHFGNEYLRGWLRLIEVDSSGERMLAELCNVHHSNFHNGATEYVGFGRNSVALLPPVWDEWFREEIRYDPRSGEVHYTVNDTAIGWTETAMGAGPGSMVRIDLSSYGWFTGHWTEYARIHVAQ